MLSNQIFFRKIISIFLICVFAFSITPVIFLHNLVANHKDISYSDSKQTNDQYARAGINCHCINFVAEAQFLNAFLPIEISSCVLHATRALFYTTAFYSQYHFYAELRGPPAFFRKIHNPFYSVSYYTGDKSYLFLFTNCYANDTLSQVLFV